MQLPPLNVSFKCVFLQLVVQRRFFHGHGPKYPAALLLEHPSHSPGVIAKDKAAWKHSPCPQMGVRVLINCFLFLKIQCSSTIWVNVIYFKVTAQGSELIWANQTLLTSEELGATSRGQQKGESGPHFRNKVTDKKQEKSYCNHCSSLCCNTVIPLPSKENWRAGTVKHQGLSFSNTFPSL